MMSACMAAMPSLSVLAATFADPKFSEQAIATGLGPTAMDIAPDGRIFVCSKNGTLHVVKNGQLLPKPFLKLTVPTASEQGLLGVAFHPKFADSPFVYVYYTVTSPQHNRVSRFLAKGDTAGGPEEAIFDMDEVTAQNHMSGAIHFGNDGKLYIASGNSAKSEFSLSMTSTLGKILRINSDGSIPTDNPFYAQTTGKARAIWTAGMRNTFTFSVDKVSGRIFGCEVGDGAEEVNELIGGSNYGYGTQEGYSAPRDLSKIVGTFRPAIYTYSGGCIIAASFYPPATGSLPRNFPQSFHRKFFFADYNTGWMKVLDIANPTAVSDFASGASNPVDIKFAADGTLYYLSRGRQSGSLMRVTHSDGPTAISPLARHPARSAGWTLVSSPHGRHPWQAGARSVDIRGLDGKSLALPSGSPQPGSPLALPGQGEGLFWVRFR
jgi:glucose/arabinose dehydrogenase